MVLVEVLTLDLRDYRISISGCGCNFELNLSLSFFLIIPLVIFLEDKKNC